MITKQLNTLSFCIDMRRFWCATDCINIYKNKNYNYSLLYYSLPLSFPVSLTLFRFRLMDMCAYERATTVRLYCISHRRDGGQCYRFAQHEILQFSTALVVENTRFHNFSCLPKSIDFLVIIIKNILGITIAIISPLSCRAHSLQTGFRQWNFAMWMKKWENQIFKGRREK